MCRSALILFVFGTGFFSGPADTDTVKLAGRPAFRGVAVHGFHAGHVLLRGASGQILRKPLEQVEWLELEGRPEFNAAEQARAAGRMIQAAELYERALSLAGKVWVSELIRWRLLPLADADGRFDRAVELFAEIMATTAARDQAPAPRHPGFPGSAMNHAAAASLAAALATAPAPAAGRLRTLALELNLYRGVESLPESRPAATVVPPTASQPATTSAPVGILGLLPGDEAPSTTRPAASAPDLQLPADTFLLDSVEAALGAGDHNRASRLIERALPYVTAVDRPKWQILLGRCRIAAGRLAEAASEFLALADRESDPALAAMALYYVGVAHEQMGLADVASRVYRELLERRTVPDRVRNDTEKRLEALSKR